MSINRSPNIILVGLILIIILIGYFYNTCSTTNKELRHLLQQFEDRVRVLTVKNIAQEKTIEIVHNNQREIQEENVDIQKELEAKRAENSELLIKFNENVAQIANLSFDNTNLKEELNEMKKFNNILNSENEDLKQLQKDFDVQKESYNQKINELEKNNKEHSIVIQKLQEKSSSNSTKSDSITIESDNTITNSSVNLANNSVDDGKNKIENIDENSKINLTNNSQPIQMNKTEEITIYTTAGTKTNNSNIYPTTQRLLNNSALSQGMAHTTTVGINKAEKTINTTSTLPLNETRHGPKISTTTKPKDKHDDKSKKKEERDDKYKEEEEREDDI